MMRKTVATAIWVLGAAGGAASCLAADALPGGKDSLPMSSPHRIDLGFFDIHVCNWSDRPMFFMALFSTTRFDEIAKVEVLDADGRALGELDLGKYRINKAPGKPEKRVFISQIPVPQGAKDGWYSARVTDRAGKQSVARDFVVLAPLPIVTGAQPKPDADDIPLPKELRWNAAAGAKHYQVFIQDLWDGEKLIYTSPLLDEPRVRLPEGLLKPGGMYAWRVHARDVNEHELLGDFNHGSLGPPMKFSVAP